MDQHSQQQGQGKPAATDGQAAAQDGAAASESERRCKDIILPPRAGGSLSPHIRLRGMIIPSDPPVFSRQELFISC